MQCFTVVFLYVGLCVYWVVLNSGYLMVSTVSENITKWQLNVAQSKSS